MVICGLVFLFLTRVFNYALFNQFPIFQSVYAHISQVVAFSILILYVFFYKKISISIILMLVYMVVLLIATILGSGNYYNIAQRIYPILGFLMFMEIQIKCKRAQILMKAIANVCFVLTLVEFVLLPFSETLWGEYTFFLSGRNQMYLGLAIGILSNYYYYGIYDIRYKLYLIMSIVCIVYGESSSNLLAIAFFVLMMFIGFGKTYIRKILNIAVLVAYPALNIGVVVFRIHEYADFLIEAVLHRNLTLTSRTYIWDTALELIKQSPIWGYGVAATSNIFHVVVDRIDAPDIDRWYSGHNQYIQMLYESGIVSLLILMLLIIYGVKKINKFMSNSDASLTLTIIFSLLIVMMAEAPGWDSIFTVLFLSHLQISCYEERRLNYKYANTSQNICNHSSI